MAIYHLEAKMVSRGAGRSAVAAAAYLSCSRLLNEYDGVQHDYTRKQGLVWQQVFSAGCRSHRMAESRNIVECCGGKRKNKGQPPGP
ncbi:MAG: MobA/MobL family protein [Lacrimispora saccharolytica]